MIITWNDIIGMNIAAIGIRKEKVNSKVRPPMYWEFPDYVFMGDNETYIQFSESDYYEYHDADSSARRCEIRRSREEYNHLMTDPHIATFNTRADSENPER